MNSGKSARSLVCWLTLCLLATQGRADFPPLALKAVSQQQIVSPTDIANAGDGSGRLFVCDQSGIVYIIRDGMLLPQPFLDARSKLVPRAPTTYLFPLSSSYEERGLLSIAFHPNYNQRDGLGQPKPGFGKFYIFYSAPSPNVASGSSPVNCRSTISEFSVSTTDPNTADINSERVVLSYDKPQANHNGGQLRFGPDGLLYISAGDGGGQHDNQDGHAGGSGTSSPGPSGGLGNAQDKTRLLGKILRIDPLGSSGPGGQYGIPATNPFVGAGGGVREEIYAFGLRNPWRFSFDDGPGGNGTMFEADVGQDKVEEVNIITSGGNYGWRVMEGTLTHDGTAPNSGLPLISPIAQYAHIGVTTGTPALPQIGASIIGGFVYRGSAIPALQGRYVFGDYSQSIASANGTLLGIEETSPGSGTWNFSKLVIAGGNPLTTRVYAFGRDEAGEIYVATKVSRGPFELDANGKPTGAIYKIVQAQVSTATLTPAHDNSIYSDFVNNSNALGDLYSGNNANSAPRRALFSFDVTSGLPGGAQVTSASLTLNLKNAASNLNHPMATMALYSLKAGWGEGTSLASGGGGSGTAATTGDATWIASLYDATSPIRWVTPGGVFSSTSSATNTVGTALGSYVWSSQQMGADVQGWLTTPASNFGWILVGDESASATARVFTSREGSASLQPKLVVSYNPVAPPLSRRDSWLRQYYPTPGTYVDDNADPDNDGVANLVEYAFAFSPLSANSASAGLQAGVSAAAGNTTFTLVFRRDPRATDLTYQMQTSDDLVTWSTITQSSAGGAPSGTGFVTETDAPGESPVKNVTAAETLSVNPRRFARLRIIRVAQ
ncbi:PQQ-dependent sugar dehydrogenase [Prosthecobacter vanneervenii]|uniref:Glucose/arabinose dehydrogenase n=1 Tax=Prosthecobacter vanneervenii TaxID=48466 RepID=A0A7W7Y9R3_9BACT|nr:PQQ-dependent sugar dehydrogenase [Prosthecobacter vanneervenii]MBB5032189.1 glucose/arabinose dehydrogenase [Prosthecobacter vanneervenii]